MAWLQLFRAIWPPNCRQITPLVLALLVQTLTGCTLVGYAVGSARTPAPQSVAPESARAIPPGTDVELSYTPRPSEQAPATGELSPQASCAHPTAELSIATGTFRGIEAGQLVLEQQVLGGVAAAELYGSGGSSLETRRFSLPLERVSCIRTKPSLAPRLVGALVGAAVDVAVVAAYAAAVRDIQ